MRCLRTAAVLQVLSWMLVCGWAARGLGQAGVVTQNGTQNGERNGAQDRHAAAAEQVSANLIDPLRAEAGRPETDLPDSPGAVLRRRTEPAAPGDAAAAADDPDTPRQSADNRAAAAAAKASDKRGVIPCGTAATRGGTGAGAVAPGAVPVRTPMAAGSGGGAVSCPAPPPAANPYTRFLNSTAPIPLTPRQKAYLAVHNFLDPGNIVTVLGTSAIAIGSDAHTAYGPGMRGFGENAGLSFVQDATGDFFGTFLVPSLTHEDPHYHRRPEASVPRRIVHAISRTVIAQGDDGHPMPNYATLLNYPITAEIANLYVPGVAGNAPATVKRVLVGYATDPIDNLITEFLPDVAKRVHVRVIFVQQIVNQVAAGQPVSMF